MPAASAPDFSTLLPVFNALPGAYLLLSPELIIEAASDAYVASTLMARERLLGRYLFEVFPDNPAAPEAHGQRNLRASLAQVLATGQPHEMAPPHYDLPDPAAPGRVGQQHWLTSNTPVLDAQGQVRHIIHTVTNITGQVRADAELARSQAAAAARADAERQRQQVHEVLMQAPALICLFQGPAHVFSLVNPPYQQLVGQRPLLGRPIREAMPELAGQPIFSLLDKVYQTGETFYAQEMLVQLDHANTGDQELGQNYYNFIYQATRELSGAINGILVFAYEVTAQVRTRRQVEYGRQQVQDLNEELAATNEELRATNEEFLASNAELTRTQQQLRQLNQELETRVAARTTEALAARAETERQRERLERLFMQAPAAICILDGPELVFELVNPGYQRLFPGRDLQGQPLLAALPELTNHAAWRSLQRVYQTGQTHEEQNMLIPVARHAGAPLENRYFNYVQQPRYDEHGQIDGVVVFAFDTTGQVRDRQRADTLQTEAMAAARRQTQERETLYQVFERTPAAICIQRGPTHRYEYVNQAYQDFFPDRQLLGRPVAEALPEIVPQGIVALLDKVYKTGETYFGHEVPLTITPGARPPEDHYYTFTYQAYRENGQIVGISTFAYDVSEQVQSKQEATRQSQLLHQLFLEAPAPIVILDGPELVFELVNPAYQQIFPGRELRGKPLLVALPELAGTPIPELFRRVYQTGEPYVAQELPLMMARHEGGPLEEIYWTFTYQARHNAAGAVDGVMVFAHEVTDQVRARRVVEQSGQQAQAQAQALTAANQQLTRANVDLDNFIYTASHDLKAPITNIEGLLHVLREQLPAATQRAGAVQPVLAMMQGAIERFQLTIAQLTDVSRLQQAQPAEAVDLAALVEDVRLDLASVLVAAGARLTVEVAACPQVLFAPKNLRSIIYNLLSNAVKYGHPGRLPVVELRAYPLPGSQGQGESQASGGVVLEVQDNGLGLDETQQAKLFVMFQRLHDHVEGSGIGLYMVKKIVDNAGGTIQVQSQPGVGSTFTVTLLA
ncbi:PAS domain-containing protein [uncultured Hymenobacter sp.]|uniref:PAS domain-containing protein n=1 Tax=uncultured Hymenobacter sp. TaxID=170016 RepID=UPI0035CC3227